ncbi:hypothetical protein E2320_016374 [Naja naja]|nr:hypothetical protein E2320_016374 [Naja naja]
MMCLLISSAETLLFLEVALRLKNLTNNGTNFSSIMKISFPAFNIIHLSAAIQDISAWPIEMESQFRYLE